MEYLHFFDGSPESFRPSEGEGRDKMSEQAYEQFQEQMRQTAQQLKALQKGEQKKKKKEDRLQKILTDFWKKRTRAGVVNSAVKLLAENIPPLFVLGVMILTDHQSMEEAGKVLQEEGRRLSPLSFVEEDFELVPEANGVLTDWMNIVAEYAGRDPIKFLKTIKNQDKKLKYIVVEFVGKVLKEYFDEKSMEADQENLNQFGVIVMQKVIEAVQQNAEHLDHLHQNEDLGGPAEPRGM